MHYFKAVITLLLFLLLSSPIYAQGGYTIEYNNTIIRIEASGDIEVNENLKIVFSEKRRGIFRNIPYKYNINGKNLSTEITDINVENQKVKTTKKNGEYSIRIGDANKYIIGNQDYNISYKIKGAIARYDDHDEFFMNVVGFKSESSTKRTSFRIEYPNSWKDSINVWQAFSGPKGSTTNEVVLHKEDNALIGALRSVLPPNHGVSIGIQIPKGLLSDDMDRSSNSKQGEQLDWIFTWWNLIPVSLATLLLGFWNKIEKKEENDPEIKKQFYPPEGMNPAEVGTFFDHRANRRDIISLLPHWGNKGYILIKPVQGSQSDMYFSKLVPNPPHLKKYEQQFFNDLFEKSDIVLLSDLKDKFYKTMTKTSSLLTKEVYHEELFDQASKKTFHSGWSILAAIVCILGGIAVILAIGAFVAGIGLFLIAITILVLHFRVPKLSPKGVDLHRQLKGLYNFLKEPDGAKMNSLIEKDPDYLHHIYPYVLAFDLDQSWVSFQEDDFSMTAPIWFDTGHQVNKGFRYDSLSDSFNVRKIEKVFYSAPPPVNSTSSSGGGFSGGSAGGGFGGGSTGSW